MFDVCCCYAYVGRSWDFNEKISIYSDYIIAHNWSKQMKSSTSICQLGALGSETYESQVSLYNSIYFMCENNSTVFKPKKLEGQTHLVLYTIWQLISVGIIGIYYDILSALLYLAFRLFYWVTRLETLVKFCSKMVWVMLVNIGLFTLAVYHRSLTSLIVFLIISSGLFELVRCECEVDAFSSSLGKSGAGESHYINTLNIQEGTCINMGQTTVEVLGIGQEIEFLFNFVSPNDVMFHQMCKSYRCRSKDRVSLECNCKGYTKDIYADMEMYHSCIWSGLACAKCEGVGRIGVRLCMEEFEEVSFYDSAEILGSKYVQFRIHELGKSWDIKVQMGSDYYGSSNTIKITDLIIPDELYPKTVAVYKDQAYCSQKILGNEDICYSLDKSNSTNFEKENCFNLEYSKGYADWDKYYITTKWQENHASRLIGVMTKCRLYDIKIRESSLIMHMKFETARVSLWYTEKVKNIISRDCIIKNWIHSVSSGTTNDYSYSIVNITGRVIRPCIVNVNVSNCYLVSKNNWAVKTNFKFNLKMVCGVFLTSTICLNDNCQKVSGLTRDIKWVLDKHWHLDTNMSLLSGNIDISGTLYGIRSVFQSVYKWGASVFGGFLRYLPVILIFCVAAYIYALGYVAISVVFVGIGIAYMFGAFVMAHNQNELNFFSFSVLLVVILFVRYLSGPVIKVVLRNMYRGVSSLRINFRSKLFVLIFSCCLAIVNTQYLYIYILVKIIVYFVTGSSTDIWCIMLERFIPYPNPTGKIICTEDFIRNNNKNTIVDNRLSLRYNLSRLYVYNFIKKQGYYAHHIDGVEIGPYHTGNYKYRLLNDIGSNSLCYKQLYLLYTLRYKVSVRTNFEEGKCGHIIRGKFKTGICEQHDPDEFDLNHCNCDMIYYMESPDSGIERGQFFIMQVHDSDEGIMTRGSLFESTMSSAEGENASILVYQDRSLTSSTSSDEVINIRHRSKVNISKEFWDVSLSSCSTVIEEIQLPEGPFVSNIGYDNQMEYMARTLMETRYSKKWMYFNLVYTRIPLDLSKLDEIELDELNTTVTEEEFLKFDGETQMVVNHLYPDIRNKYIYPDITSNYPLDIITKHVYVNGVMYQAIPGISYAGADWYCIYEPTKTLKSGTPVINSFNQICSLITCSDNRGFYAVIGNIQAPFSITEFRRYHSDEEVPPDETMLGRPDTKVLYCQKINSHLNFVTANMNNIIGKDKLIFFVSNSIPAASGCAGFAGQVYKTSNIDFVNNEAEAKEKNIYAIKVKTPNGKLDCIKLILELKEILNEGDEEWYTVLNCSGVWGLDKSVSVQTHYLLSLGLKNVLNICIEDRTFQEIIPAINSLTTGTTWGENLKTADLWEYLEKQKAVFTEPDQVDTKPFTTGATICTQCFSKGGEKRKMVSLLLEPISNPWYGHDHCIYAQKLRCLASIYKCNFKLLEISEIDEGTEINIDANTQNMNYWSYIQVKPSEEVRLYRTLLCERNKSHVVNIVNSYTNLNKDNCKNIQQAADHLEFLNDNVIGVGKITNGIFSEGSAGISNGTIITNNHVTRGQDIKFRYDKIEYKFGHNGVDSNVDVLNYGNGVNFRAPVVNHLYTMFIKCNSKLVRVIMECSKSEAVEDKIIAIFMPVVLERKAVRKNNRTVYQIIKVPINTRGFPGSSGSLIFDLDGTPVGIYGASSVYTDQVTGEAAEMVNSIVSGDSRQLNGLFSALAKHFYETKPRYASLVAQTGSGKTVRFVSELARLGVNTTTILLIPTRSACTVCYKSYENLFKNDPNFVNNVTVFLRMGIGIQGDDDEEYKTFGKGKNSLYIMTYGKYLVDTQFGSRFTLVDHLVLDEIHQRTPEVVATQILVEQKNKGCCIALTATDPGLGAKWKRIHETITVPNKYNVKEIDVNSLKKTANNYLIGTDVKGKYKVTPINQDLFSRRTIIFVPTKNQADKFVIKLKELNSGLEVISYYSGKDINSVLNSGKQAIIISTDALESSVTIPGVGLVIDYGEQNYIKWKLAYNGKHNDFSVTQKIGNALNYSLQQRKGRTGRDCNGCYLKMYDHTGEEPQLFDNSTLCQIAFYNILDIDNLNCEDGNLHIIDLFDQTFRKESAGLGAEVAMNIRRGKLNGNYPPELLYMSKMITTDQFNDILTGSNSKWSIASDRNSYTLCMGTSKFLVKDDFNKIKEELQRDGDRIKHYYLDILIEEEGNKKEIVKNEKSEFGKAVRSKMKNTHHKDMQKRLREMDKALSSSEEENSFELGHGIMIMGLMAFIISLIKVGLRKITPCTLEEIDYWAKSMHKTTTQGLPTVLQYDEPISEDALCKLESTLREQFACLKVSGTNMKDKLTKFKDKYWGKLVVGSTSQVGVGVATGENVIMNPVYDSDSSGDEFSLPDSFNQTDEFDNSLDFNTVWAQTKIFISELAINKGAMISALDIQLGCGGMVIGVLFKKLTELLGRPTAIFLVTSLTGYLGALVGMGGFTVFAATALLNFLMVKLCTREDPFNREPNLTPDLIMSLGAGGVCSYFVAPMVLGTTPAFVPNISQAHLVGNFTTRRGAAYPASSGILLAKHIYYLLTRTDWHNNKWSVTCTLLNIFLNIKNASYSSMAIAAIVGCTLAGIKWYINHENNRKVLDKAEKIKNDKIWDNVKHRFETNIDKYIDYIMGGLSVLANPISIVPVIALSIVEFFQFDEISFVDNFKENLLKWGGLGIIESTVCMVLRLWELLKPTEQLNNSLTIATHIYSAISTFSVPSNILNNFNTITSAVTKVTATMDFIKFVKWSTGKIKETFWKLIASFKDLVNNGLENFTNFFNTLGTQIGKGMISGFCSGIKDIVINVPKFLITKIRQKWEEIWAVEQLSPENKFVQSLALSIADKDGEAIELKEIITKDPAVLSTEEVQNSTTNFDRLVDHFRDVFRRPVSNTTHTNTEQFRVGYGFKNDIIELPEEYFYHGSSKKLADINFNFRKNEQIVEQCLKCQLSKNVNINMLYNDREYVDNVDSSALYILDKKLNLLRNNHIIYEIEAADITLMSVFASYYENTNHKYFYSSSADIELNCRGLISVNDKTTRGLYDSSHHQNWEILPKANLVIIRRPEYLDAAMYANEFSYDNCKDVGKFLENLEIGGSLLIKLNLLNEDQLNNLSILFSVFGKISAFKMPTQNIVSTEFWVLLEGYKKKMEINKIYRYLINIMQLNLEFMINGLNMIRLSGKNIEKPKKFNMALTSPRFSGGAVKKQIPNLSFTYENETFEMNIENRFEKLKNRWAKSKRKPILRNYSNMGYEHLLSLGSYKVKNINKKPRHTVNKFIADSLKETIGWEYKNSVIGHTQSDINAIERSMKKRLDVRNPDPSEKLRNRMLELVPMMVTPEGEKYKNKLCFSSLEEAIEMTRNKGAAGLFDDFQNMFEIQQSKDFKNDINTYMEALMRGDDLPVYETLREKCEPKLRKDVEDGRLNYPNFTLHATEIIEGQNLDPRFIQYGDLIYRHLEYIVFGKMLDIHNNVDKLYHGSITGTPPWYMGNVLKSLFESYDDRDSLVSKEAFDWTGIIFEEFDRIETGEASCLSGDFSKWDATVSLFDIYCCYKFCIQFYKKECHSAIRNMFRHRMCSIVVTSYGDIFVRVGQRGSGELKTSFDNTFLNNLYHHAISSFIFGKNLKDYFTISGKITYVKQIHEHRGEFKHFKRENSKMGILYIFKYMTHIGDGDDNNHYANKINCTKFLKETGQYWHHSGKQIRSGTSGGYDLVGDFKEVSFCSHVYQPVVIGEGAAAITSIMSESEILKNFRNFDRLYYMPYKSIPEIFGKLGCTLKRETLEDTDLSHSITASKLLSIMLLYPHVKYVAMFCLFNLSRLVNATFDFDIFNRRYNTTYSFSTVGGALKSVYGVSNLDDIGLMKGSIISRHMKNLIFNHRLVAGKTLADLKYPTLKQFIQDMTAGHIVNSGVPSDFFAAKTGISERKKVTVTFVSGNKNKIQEMHRLIGKSVNLKYKNLDLPEFQGTSREIVRQKLLHAKQHIKGPVLIEDTSLKIDCLGGNPGPYVKDFFKNISLKKIYEIAFKCNETGIENICSIGFSFNSYGSPDHIFTGSTRGKICYPKPGGFGWDPIFEIGGQSISEMSDKEKDSKMARGFAARQFEAFFKHKIRNIL